MDVEFRVAERESVTCGAFAFPHDDESVEVVDFG